jgi:hypothetical protein
MAGTDSQVVITSHHPWLCSGIEHESIMRMMGCLPVALSGILRHRFVKKVNSAVMIATAVIARPCGAR